MSYPVDESLFAKCVRQKLSRARVKHSGIVSLHEGYAVILEEMRELEAEVFNRQKPVVRILDELTQVAAMCERMATDLQLIDLESPNEHHYAAACERWGIKPERLRLPGNEATDSASVADREANA